LDSTTSTPEAVGTPTLLLRVGENLYGCDIADAREIIPFRPTTRLPGAPAFVRGLINVRGTIVTVLDLGVRLEPDRAPAEQGSIMLARFRDRLVGLVVDEVVDVRTLVIDGEATRAHADPIVRGLAMIDGAAAVILDLDALINQVLLV
jgi:purine-binding chemotaxis protein CheW